MASREWSGSAHYGYRNPIPWRSQLLDESPYPEVASALAISPQTRANRAWHCLCAIELRIDN
jgi:hypothetical protein